MKLEKIFWQSNVVVLFGIPVGLFVLPYQGVQADEVYLKNGLKRVGKIVAQTRRQIRIRTVDGSLWVVPKSQVKKLTFGKVDMAKLRQEERLRKEQRRRRQKEKEGKRLQKKNRAENAKNLEEKRRQDSRKAHPMHDIQKPQMDRLGALWRSAVLPGWGQYALGRPQRGLGFGAAFGLGAFALYDTNRQYLAAKTDYNNFGLPLGLALVPAGVDQGNLAELYLYRQPFLQKKIRMEERFNNVQAAGLVLAGIYLWNLADVWFLGATFAKSELPKSKRLSLQLSFGSSSLLPKMRRAGDLSQAAEVSGYLGFQISF